MCLALGQFRQLGQDGAVDRCQEICIGVQAAAAADEKGELGAGLAVGNDDAAPPRGVLGEQGRHRMANPQFLSMAPPPR